VITQADNIRWSSSHKGDLTLDQPDNNNEELVSRGLLAYESRYGTPFRAMIYA